MTRPVVPLPTVTLLDTSTDLATVPWYNYWAQRDRVTPIVTAGTFTSNISSATTAGIAVTYTTQDGVYVKLSSNVSNLVFFRFITQINTISSGTASQAICSLPFIVKKDAGNSENIWPVQLTNVVWGSTAATSAIARSSGGYAGMRITGMVNNGVDTPIQTANLSSGSIIAVSGVYETTE